MAHSLSAPNAGSAHHRSVSQRPTPGRIPWSLIPLAVLLLLWLWLVYQAIVRSGGPNGQVFGVDFSHTYAAMLIVSKGGNPYNFHLLSAVQHSLLGRGHLPVQPQTPSVRVGTSAFFLWVWRPLGLLSYQAAAVTWMLVTYALTAFAFLALLRYFGWRRRLVPTLIFLATPQVVLGTYYGNVIDLVFAGFACAFPLLTRYPVVAGMLLSLATLKPPVALPIALLIVLFLVPRKKAVVLGFCLAVGARQLATVVLLGPQYEWWWIQSLLGFAGSIGLQPNLASLSGLYVRWAPHTVRDGLEAVTIALACGMTAFSWWKARRQSGAPLLVTGSLWFLWMIATPYAHFVDEMLLVVPILGLLGRDGRRLTQAVCLAVLYLMTLSILLFSWSPLPGQFLWLPLLAVAICFEIASKSGSSSMASQVRHGGVIPPVLRLAPPRAALVAAAGLGHGSALPCGERARGLEPGSGGQRDV